MNLDQRYHRGFMPVWDWLWTLVPAYDLWIRKGESIMKDQTNITQDYRIQFKHFVWSKVFIAPFPDYESADNWRRMNWPDADHLPFTGKTLGGNNND